LLSKAKREAESRGVCAVSVSSGAGAPHRTLTWPGRDTWRAPGRWIETGIRGQEAAGRFWKSEAGVPRGRTCRPSAAATSRGSEPGDARGEGRCRVETWPAAI
jgi:hypothetical protein